jgi:hypothetical protein
LAQEKIMKISELIAAVGKGRMSFQTLDTSLISLDRGPRKSTVVKFETSEAFTDNRTARMGVIVWLDRDAVHEVLQTISAPAMTDDDWGPSPYVEELAESPRVQVA